MWTKLTKNIVKYLIFVIKIIISINFQIVLIIILFHLKNASNISIIWGNFPNKSNLYQFQRMAKQTCACKGIRKCAICNPSNETETTNSNE